MLLLVIAKTGVRAATSCAAVTINVASEEANCLGPQPKSFPNPGVEWFGSSQTDLDGFTGVPPLH